VNKCLAAEKEKKEKSEPIKGRRCVVVFATSRRGPGVKK